MHREIDRLFDDTFEASAFRRWPCHAGRRTGRASEAGAGHPGDRQAVQDFFGGPGVEEKDIHITLDNDVLLVRVKSVRSRKAKTAVSTGWSALRQLSARSEPADRCQPGHDQAAFKNGVLTITMEKREASAPSRAARSRSTADADRLVLYRKPSEWRGAVTFGASSNQSSQEHEHGQKTMPGLRPARHGAGEANLNGRHSTMLLCDDHYRHWRASKSAPSRRWKPCLARARLVRRLPRQRLLPHR